MQFGNAVLMVLYNKNKKFEMDLKYKFFVDGENYGLFILLSVK